jgi:hypothetical protein
MSYYPDKATNNMKLTLSTRSKMQIQAIVSDHLDPEKKIVKHTLEAYLFVPKSLGINVHTYPKYLFYRDMQTYSDLLPHLRPLNHLLSSPNGLLLRMKKCIDTLIHAGDEQALREYETRNRAFCRILKITMDNHFEYIRRKGDTAVSKRGVEQYLDKTHQILQQFRAVGEALVKPCPKQEFTSIFLLSDEYLSLLIEETSCRMEDLLQSWKSDWSMESGRQLHQLALAELNYRKARNYDSVPNQKGRNEHLVYRYNTLRTYMESVFYLSTEHKPEGRLTQELLLSMAAGLAMVFATAAAFLAHVQYENWTTTFFVVLVVSYMFKDRIKAMTQNYLKTKGQQMFFDFRTTIYGQTTQRPLGVQKESFGFVDAAKIDPEVMKYRNRDRLAALDNDYCGEQIILYKRRTRLHPERIIEAFDECGINGINEIIYFDFTRFARKMENSKSTVFIPGEKSYHKLNGRYVYHLHLVVKYSSDVQPVYQHFRVVMTRNGIQRIDTIAV